MGRENRITKEFLKIMAKKIIGFHNQGKKRDYELGQIGNMDDMSINLMWYHNRTLDVEVSKIVNVKSGGLERTHYTSVLSCCVDGRKLPILLNFH